MNYHARWFVDKEQVLVFVYDIQRYFFRYHLCLAGRLGQSHDDLVEGANLVVWLDGNVVYPDETTADGLLYLIPAGVPDPLGQEAVDAQQALTGIGPETMVFVQLLAFRIVNLFLVHLPCNLSSKVHN
jgi:hypothetical protein